MEEKHYETILKALAEKIAMLETTNSLQKWQISKLEKALEEAELQKKENAITQAASQL